MPKPTRAEIEQKNLTENRLLRSSSGPVQEGSATQEPGNTAHPDAAHGIKFEGTAVLSDKPSQMEQTLQGAAPSLFKQTGNAQRNTDRDERRLEQQRINYMKEDGRLLDDGEAKNAAVLDQIDAQKAQALASNDVTDPMIDAFKEDEKAAIAKFKMNDMQVATAHARLKQKDKIQPPSGPQEAGQELLDSDADLAPEQVLEPLFSKAEVEAHLGHFADGAHAFVDPDTSKRIMVPGKDKRFEGWGIDANFVAPLKEANALNTKAHNEFGIVTIEDELGIGGRCWSRSEWNENKEMVRWVIPKPAINLKDAETGKVLLSMATGKEVKALPKEWVAGGFTKGGVHEATLKAIPREDLVTALSGGKIKTFVETYSETPDKIDEGFQTPKRSGDRPAEGAQESSSDLKKIGQSGAG